MWWVKMLLWRTLRTGLTSPLYEEANTSAFYMQLCATICNSSYFKPIIIIYSTWTVNHSEEFSRDPL